VPSVRELEVNTVPNKFVDAEEELDNKHIYIGNRDAEEDYSS
jgi:hypothetical protein